jgi:hypothetical protein
MSRGHMSRVVCRPARSRSDDIALLCTVFSSAHTAIDVQRVHARHRGGQYRTSHVDSYAIDGQGED